MVYGGAFGDVFIKYVLASIIKKGAPTLESQDRHHRAQVECARQMYDLDRFSSLPVSWCQWETGFLDRRRTIKRGSQVSNLIASLWRAQTFAYLHIIFLGSYLDFIHVRIQSLCSSLYQALVNQKRISYEYLVYKFEFYREVYLSKLGFILSC